MGHSAFTCITGSKSFKEMLSQKDDYLIVGLSTDNFNLIVKDKSVIFL